MTENTSVFFGQQTQNNLFWLKLTCFRQNVSSRTKEKNDSGFSQVKTFLRKNEPLVFRATIYFFQLTRVQSIGPLELTWKIESFPTFRNLVNNKNNNTSKSKDGLCSYGIPLSNDTLYLEKGFVCVVFDSHKPADHISSKS